MKHLLLTIAFIIPLLLLSCDNESDDTKKEGIESLAPYLGYYYECLNLDDSEDCIKWFMIGGAYNIDVYFINESNNIGTIYTYSKDKITFTSFKTNIEYNIYYKIQNGEITFYNGDYIYKKREE